jgi:hypothetical protein
MQETSIVQGTIKIIGRVHGALNTIVTYYDDPQGWVMKQFMTQEELDSFASEQCLIIQAQENSNG